MAKSPVFKRLIETLKTGRGADGKKKDVVFCSEESGLQLDQLSEDEVEEFIGAIRKTEVRVIAVPLSLTCESEVPKRLRKFLGVSETCSVGFIEQRHGRQVTFISAVLFKKRYGRGNPRKNEEFIV